MRDLQGNYSEIRGVIIDLDGTMLDTAPDFAVAVNHTRAEFDLAPLDLMTVTHFVGKGSENLIRQVLATDFTPPMVEAHFARALASYQTHYLAINGSHSRLYPDVEAGLVKLQAAGLAMACVTNKPIAFALPLLKQFGLHSYFSVVYGGDSLARKKPDPLPLLQVCRDFELAPQQVIAIGDSSNDAIAARAAGCGVLTVPYGYNHGEPVQNIDSDGIVTTLLEAANLITSH